MLNSEVSSGTNSCPICYWYVLRLWELIWLCLKIEFKIRIFSLSVLYYSYSNQKIQFIFHKKLSYADHPWYLCIAKLWSCSNIFSGQTPDLFLKVLNLTKYQLAVWWSVRVRASSEEWGFCWGLTGSEALRVTVRRLPRLLLTAWWHILAVERSFMIQYNYGLFTLVRGFSRACCRINQIAIM